MDEYPLLTGTVYASQGSWYIVRLEGGSQVRARARGQLKLENKRLRQTNPIAVGDVVQLLYKEPDYIIHRIVNRTNAFFRRINRTGIEQILATNIDALCIVVSLRQPYTPMYFIEQLIIAAELYHITPILLFTKTDLYSARDFSKSDSLQAIYSQLGYQSYMLHHRDEDALQRIVSSLVDKRALLIGYSGSGKSTLINQIFPHAKATTQLVNQTFGSGRHTTTYSRMYELTSPRVCVIDSPGIRSFDLPYIAPDSLRLYMREFKLYQHDCTFTNCTHIHEENCAVKAALANKKISIKRYTHYLDVYDYLTNLQQQCPNQYGHTT